MAKHYDVVVIGSGGGVKLALPAASQGKRVAFIEARDAGGTCLNRGCIPSKMLIYPATLADHIRESAKLDIVSPEATLSFSDLVSRTDRTVADVSRGLAARFSETPNLDYYAAHARFRSNHELSAGDTVITGDMIFIATGSRPQIPDIPGLRDSPYMTSEDALKRTDLPERLVVLGAGYIAVELGGMFRSAGSTVDFIVRSRPLRREDREISDEFTRVFGHRHNLHIGYTPRAVSHANGTFTVCCDDADKHTQHVTGDALLVATGVVPESDRLGLGNTDIQTDDDGYILVDGNLQTHVPNVFALGDVVGNHLFRHTVNYEGEYLFDQCFAGGVSCPLDYGPVPHAVFGMPEVAGVGLTEEDARERNFDFIVGKATYNDSTPGMARRSDHGFVKILVERATRKIIGAHIVGDEAATMIHLFIVLMKKNGVLDDLLDMIFIHPALPEVARDAARHARDVLNTTP